MKNLKKDWVTEGLLDFEYKKYVLLAYLKHVERHFDETRLYPFMSDLLERLTDLKTLKHERKTLREEFPKKISRIDLNKIELIYDELYQYDNLPPEIEEVIEYAIPTMERTIGKGREVHDEVSSELVIDPVGIIPLYKDEGYVLMENGSLSLTEVFQYQVRKFIMHNEQYRGIYFQWIDRIKRGLGETVEHIKMQLIRTYKVLPNPATFVVYSKQPYPMEETMLPMTKKLVMQTISSMK
ncbi:hypothetical protein [Roseivirga pacifica]